MDTTRLDVFAFDPFTLKWVQAELTVSMDWYDRCICRLLSLSQIAAVCHAFTFAAGPA